MDSFRAFMLEGVSHGTPRSMGTRAFTSSYGWDDMIWRGVHSVAGVAVMEYARRGYTLPDEYKDVKVGED